MASTKRTPIAAIRPIFQATSGWATSTSTKRPTIMATMVPAVRASSGRTFSARASAYAPKTAAAVMTPAGTDTARTRRRKPGR